MSPRILIVGAGGREHALAWGLAREAGRPDVVVAPGNPGIAREFSCVAATVDDPTSVVAVAREVRPQLVVIGPEAALAAGVSDALGEAGFAVFGPSRAAAAVETSKWFAKDVMRAAGVPTARAERFAEVRPALAALDHRAPPWVIKADGLAAGKGVLVTRSAEEARAFVRECLEGGRFGASGRHVLIEEHLAGEEASVIAICDGSRHVLLPPARDFKRAFDGDTGPNTGGMGAIAPTAAVTPALEERLSARVFGPVLAELAARGTPYRGAMYAGLMLTTAGPHVIEFNARFGDPETQSLVPLVGGSLATLLASAAAGRLEPGAIERRPFAAATLALVDAGYPGRAQGGEITGLAALPPTADERGGTAVFLGAGEWAGDAWRFRGGRAAYLTGFGPTAADARARVHAARGQLSGHGWRSRDDVLHEAMVP